MSMPKLFQAKDIDDLKMLAGFLRGGTPRSLWDVQSDWHVFPPKVVQAKLDALVRRGLLDGCACGCRGDFTLTDAGFEFNVTCGGRIAR